MSMKDALKKIEENPELKKLLMDSHAAYVTAMRNSFNIDDTWLYCGRRTLTQSDWEWFVDNAGFDNLRVIVMTQYEDATSAEFFISEEGRENLRAWHETMNDGGEAHE